MQTKTPEEQIQELILEGSDEGLEDKLLKDILAKLQLQELEQKVVEEEENTEVEEDEAENILFVSYGEEVEKNCYQQEKQPYEKDQPQEEEYFEYTG
ncbi:MAG: hypothetical protein ISS23_02590 [Nanoarchaeota archaeon]|nr:hypothetical protein [Nanoarchaeota archaeon]